MAPNRMSIIVLSLTCCNPKLATYDQQYVSRIKAALTSLGLEATVEVTSATDALFGLKMVKPQKIWDLFDKYGTAVAPVLFINGELALYGGVPSLERLEDVIGKAAKKTEPAA